MELDYLLLLFEWVKTGNATNESSDKLSSSCDWHWFYVVKGIDLLEIAIVRVERYMLSHPSLVAPRATSMLSDSTSDCNV